jgi:uncharacterized membrane protein YeaQ/YmgE (transglycosylase-associated protein family)
VEFSGSCAGLLISFVSRMKVGVLQAALIGISGAFLSGGLLEMVTAISEVGLTNALAISFLGGVIFGVVVAVVSKKWHLLPAFQRPQAWSFVQPFEE